MAKATKALADLSDDELTRKIADGLERAARNIRAAGELNAVSSDTLGQLNDALEALGSDLRDIRQAVERGRTNA